MKHLLTILLFLPLFGMGQTHHVVKVGQGEYTRLEILDNGQGGTLTNDIALMGNTAGGQQGVFNPIGTATPMVFCLANLHNGVYLDASGNAWFMGQPDGNPYITGSGIYEANTDSAGNTITGGFSTMATGWQAADGAYAWFYGIRNSDSSLMGCGDLQHGMRGIHGAAGSLTSKWVATPLPNGEKAKSIMGSQNLFVLCWSGHVYALTNSGSYQADAGWGTSPGFASAGSYSSTYDQPNELLVSGVPLAHIQMIAGGMDCNWAIDSSKNAYAWSVNGWRVGHSTSVGTDILANPTLMNSKLSPYFNPSLVDTIVTDGACQHVLLSNGTVWGWGSNEQGTVGNGLQMNFLSTSPAYDDNGGNENAGGFVQFTPTQVAPGKSDFVTLNNGIYYNYYDVAFDAEGRKIVWGRNKACALETKTKPIDSVIGTTQADYPSSWQRPDPTYEFNEDTVTQVWASTSPGCYNACVAGPTTGSPCSLNPPTCYTNHAHLSLTSSGLTIYATATASTTTGFLTYVVFTATGPGTINRGVPDNPVTQTDTMTVSAPGTYTVKVVVQDPSWGVDSTTATITVSNGTAYYFAAAGSGTACTSTAPCAPSYIPTITPLLNPGNTVFLNKGDVFPIDMLISVSGAAGNDITITSYGSGPDPVLGGMPTLTGWTNTSGNLWSATWSGPSPRLLTENGALSGKSTTPNRTSGYWTFIPGSGSTTDLHFATNHFNTGDTGFAKSSGYTFDQFIVTASTSTDATISPALYSNSAGGNGAARIGDTPDSNTEWNLPSAGTVQAYSIGAPTGYAVPNVGVPLTISGSYIKVTGIKIMGADTTCINLSGSHDVITSDTLEYGMDWIWTTSATSDTVTNNYIAHFGNGMRKTNFANYNNVWENNTITDCGQIPGMGTPGGTTTNYSAICAGDSGNIVKFNNITYVGYLPISIQGSRFVADSNQIAYYCLLHPDGGAIYTYASLSTIFSPRDIRGNLISHGGGPLTLLGTSLGQETAGIYLDNWSSQDTVEGNSVDSVAAFAYYDHGPKNIFLYDNSYASGTGEFFAGEVNALIITGLVVKYCQFAATNSGALPMDIYTVNNDLASFGVIDSNSYFSYRQLVGGWKTQSSVDPGTSRGISSWQTATPYDPSSTWMSGPTIYLTGGMTGQTYNLGAGLYMDASGNLYHGTIAVPAYQSMILIRYDKSYIEGPTPFFRFVQ